MKWKSFWFRMIPVAALVLVTVSMAAIIYTQIMQSEEEICWQRLEVATTARQVKSPQG